MHLPIRNEVNSDENVTTFTGVVMIVSHTYWFRSRIYPNWYTRTDCTHTVDKSEYNFY